MDSFNAHIELVAPYPELPCCISHIEDFDLLAMMRAAKIIMRAIKQGPNIVYQGTPGDGNYVWGRVLTHLPQGFSIMQTPGYSWPSTQAWLGARDGVAEYGYYIAKELGRRNGHSTIHDSEVFYAAMMKPGVRPSWWGDPAVHYSHRCYLNNRNTDHYGKYNWNPVKQSSVLLPPDSASTTGQRGD